ncbi:MAG: DNA repair protein RecN [Burkholderiales bacterium]|jgi:DNA repair protein RecN (Recombination protein N)|nr:DNA repair protein RecN [Burkholderiales bacterium]
MLTALRLRDFVIVEAVELEFGPGFTVLSGETGAGKSILIDALGLALGARADSGVVREGAPRADIVAEFYTDARLDAWLAERDLAGDPGAVLMRRVVEADGRSRALVNGHPATVAQLREIGESLVEVHGQHASQSLLRPDGQRGLLDRYAGAASELVALAQAHAAWRGLDKELERARTGERELVLERERLQWQADELAQVAPVPGEWDELAAEQKRLANAASLIEGARGLADALSDGDDAIADRLHAIQQKLKPLAAVDASLAPVLELLETAAIQAGEAGSTLCAYADRVDLDPARLAEVEARIGVLYAAGRKFRLPPERLGDELASLRTRLEALVRAQDVEALEHRVEAARADYEKLASALSKRRAKAATTLSKGVSDRIGRLGMQGGRLEIALERGEPASHGIDRVEFRVAGHAGATPRALGKVASGGELSRISLAISELAAEANPVPTLIFDEADSGVGGAVAEVIGELMRRLGESRQVLCVTHLPQVAAKANQHFSVSKQQDAGRTTSLIEQLDRGRRVEEIARMLGGVAITATTRKHARELLG